MFMLERPSMFICHPDLEFIVLYNLTLLICSTVSTIFLKLYGARDSSFSPSWNLFKTGGVYFNQLQGAYT
jgi:hypothetical protein